MYIRMCTPQSIYNNISFSRNRKCLWGETGKRWVGEICKDPELVHAWPGGERDWTCSGDDKVGKALVLGIYGPCSETEDAVTFTKTARKFNQYACNKLFETLRLSGPTPKLGEARLFYNIEPTFPVVAMVGLGHECYGYNETEQRDEAKEAIRIAVGAGVRALQAIDVRKLYVESFGHAESAAEGAGLALWTYQGLKNKRKRSRMPILGLYDDCDQKGWDIGLEKASAQNLARQMTEAPSNLMTPLGFALDTVEVVSRTGVSSEVRVQDWIEENKMGALLAVARGSVETPIFLELIYNGCDPCTPPVVMIGKGITFDSGGLCLKNDSELAYMRGDMAGAACVVATMKAISSLRLPVNVRALIPLCENMPGASATKPGDVVRAMNGKSILISNTDYEGVLVLSDALSYAQKYKPKFILDVGTLTKEMFEMMGNSATGVFTNNDSLWESMKSASVHTGDRVWRFPLWKMYNRLVVPKDHSSDLSNSPRAHIGLTCSSAAFLHSFTCDYDWIHLDSYGVMRGNSSTSYLTPGMSGRPTRTMIEFLAQFGCQSCD